MKYACADNHGYQRNTHALTILDINDSLKFQMGLLTTSEIGALENMNFYFLRIRKIALFANAANPLIVKIHLNNLK